MKGYSRTVVFSEDEQTALARATLLVSGLPEIEGLRCHELARAVGFTLGLEVVDGHYGAVDHSWCVLKRDTMHCRATRKGVPMASILDVYSVGRLPMVQLVVDAIGLPHWESFRAGATRTDIDASMVSRLKRIFE